MLLPIRYANIPEERYLPALLLGYMYPTWVDLRPNADTSRSFCFWEYMLGSAPWVTCARDYRSSAQETLVHVFHWALNDEVKGGSNHSNNMNYQLYTDEITSISDAQKVDSGMQTSPVPSQAEIQILLRAIWWLAKVGEV
jgi:hypothetical protein